MHLSPDQIAAASARGSYFVPASPEQVARLTMQRRVFVLDGQASLATRGGGYLETHATLLAAIALPTTAASASTALPAPQPPTPTTVPVDLGGGGPVTAPDGPAEESASPSSGIEEGRAALRRELVERAAALGLSLEDLRPKARRTTADLVEVRGERQLPVLY